MRSQQGSILSNRQYNIVAASNTHFPSHIHNVYEILCVKKGTGEAVVDGNTYRLQAGDNLVVFPLQYHSYTVGQDSQIEIYVFSPQFVGEFADMTTGKKPCHPCFYEDNLPGVPRDVSNILVAKAFFYELCAKLLERVPLTGSEESGKPLSLLDKLMLYVDENYDKPCTLTRAAALLGYDYTYLSKLFRKKTGMGFNNYVNRFRIGRATYLLFDRRRNIAEVALEVGYNAIRTFNWEFQKIMHTTPEAYRADLQE